MLSIMRTELLRLIKVAEGFRDFVTKADIPDGITHFFNSYASKQKPWYVNKDNAGVYGAKEICVYLADNGGTFSFTVDDFSYREWCKAVDMPYNISDDKLSAYAGAAEVVLEILNRDINRISYEVAKGAEIEMLENRLKELRDEE